MPRCARTYRATNDGANLRFRDSIGAPENEAGSRRFALAVLQILEYGVDFLLRKLAVHFS
jgi:hypothetical protein